MGRPEVKMMANCEQMMASSLSLIFFVPICLFQLCVSLTFFYFGDDGAGLAQLRDRFKLVIRFDDAGKLCAVRGKPFVFIGRQARSLAFFLI